MSEKFLVVFNSQGSNVFDNSNKNSVVYNVNWGAFLPKKYQKFHCHFIFKSENYAGNLTDTGFISMNIGHVNVYDGLQMTNNIGIVYPVNLLNNSSSYISTNNDNNVFSIDYPIQTAITINLKTFAGANMANMQHYCLYLCLEGIPDENII